MGSEAPDVKGTIIIHGEGVSPPAPEPGHVALKNIKISGFRAIVEVADPEGPFLVVPPDEEGPILEADEGMVVPAGNFEDLLGGGKEGGRRGRTKVNVVVGAPDQELLGIRDGHGKNSATKNSGNIFERELLGFRVVLRFAHVSPEAELASQVQAPGIDIPVLGDRDHVGIPRGNVLDPPDGGHQERSISIFGIPEAELPVRVETPGVKIAAEGYGVGGTTPARDDRDSGKVDRGGGGGGLFLLEPELAFVVGTPGVEFAGFCGGQGVGTARGEGDYFFVVGERLRRHVSRTKIKNCRVCSQPRL
jgi:hypothetical protein